MVCGPEIDEGFGPFEAEWNRCEHAYLAARQAMLERPVRSISDLAELAEFVRVEEGLSAEALNEDGESSTVGVLFDAIAALNAGGANG